LREGRSIRPCPASLASLWWAKLWVGAEALVLGFVPRGLGPSDQSLSLSLPFSSFPGYQKKTPMIALGSRHTLRSLSPPCLATQGKSWRKRKKVRCPRSDGLPQPRWWVGLPEVCVGWTPFMSRRLCEGQGDNCKALSLIARPQCQARCVYQTGLSLAVSLYCARGGAACGHQGSGPGRCQPHN
jgi:hypothetical protein